MHCLGDWKKVVHQGPWTFRGWGVLIEDYDGLSNPESATFDGMYVWAQIHGIPELYRKPTIVDDLSRKIGLVSETQLSPKLFFEGNYVRVRVRVAKALMRFVTLNIPDGKKRLMVKYEKIPYYCNIVGSWDTTMRSVAMEIGRKSSCNGDPGLWPHVELPNLSLPLGGYSTCAKPWW
jgi:hypothetical protein